jgi:serine/threonine-protein kinase
VSFFIRGPWSPTTKVRSPDQSQAKRVLGVLATVMVLTTYAGAVLLARRNLRDNRADRRSAARLAIVYLIVFVTAWIVGGHHLSSLSEETTNFFRVLRVAVLEAGTLWVFYLALEPYGRRFWPDGLVGWTRLFAGHVRDPRIGRDILTGAAFGGALLIIDVFRRLSPLLIGRPPGLPTLGRDVSALIGFGPTTISWVLQLFGSVEFALIAVMLFVVVRLLVRRTWIAIGVGVTILTGVLAANAHPGDVLWLYALSQAVGVSLATFAMFRYGLLVTTIMVVVDNIPSAVPISLYGSSWAAAPGNLSMALVIALACFGFYAARAGQPLLGSIGAR